MKKRIFGILLMGAMVVASVSMFTSCKDYDDDIQKNSDDIAALTTQLSTLNSALTTAQGTADAAKSAANAAAEAAQKAQEAADAAKAAAGGAQETADAAVAAAAAADAAAAEAAQKAADAAAAAQTVEDLKATVSTVEQTLQAVKDGSIDKEAYEAKIKEIEQAIAAINESLLTILTEDDVKKLLEEQDFASGAVVKDLESQIAALNKFKEAIESLGLDKLNLTADWKKGVDDAVAELAQIKKDIAAKADKTTVDALKNSVDKAVAAMGKVDNFAGNIDNLNVFVLRLVRSINLSPAKFYGGIEGISIFAYTPDQEKNQGKENSAVCTDPTDYKNYKDYHWFERGAAVTLSKIGTADYHISPKTVDLKGDDLNFFTRSSDIKVPATTEQAKTRAEGNSGLKNSNRVTPVYTKLDDLLAKNYYNKTTGILTVPFRVDNATAIASELAKGKGTIAALQINQESKITDNKANDATVTSDYALVVPEIGKQLLICDTKFASKNTGTVWNDIPGLNKGAVNTYHLHRNFSYLALANTTATHEIVYNKSFNISEVLLTHAVSDEVAVKTAKTTKDNKTIVDTAKVADHKATALIKNADKDYDSDATLLKSLCSDLDANTLKDLKLYYDVHRVNYSLGTTATEESNHIQIKQNAKGEFIAYPRNIDASNGHTILDKEANVAAVGRMPIVCIELKYQKGDKPAASDPTVTFAYMKFLIVKGTTPPATAKEAEFEVSDVWSDCGEVSGEVKWYQIEGKVYDEKLGLDKETFDKRYIFDFYKEETIENESDKTQSKDKRYGYRFKKVNGAFAHDKDSIGQVVEEWNLSTQGKLDATTHIIKWYFTTADYIKVYKDLKKKNQLAYDWKKGEMTNKVAIETYVRYAYKSSYHQGNMNVTDGDPALYIKLTIPVGKFHWALGSLGGTKTLTYWYELNSTTNAPSKETAREVRVNAPVPVPDAKKSITKLSALTCPWNEALQITNDNLLERTEFLKDLHDYFRNGKLEAAITDKTHFKKLAQAKITPEFKFTLPDKDLGNATFSASNGTWTVKGISGATYTLKLNAAANQILIVGSPDVILCSLTKDNNNIQSVIKFHEGVKQDDILNYMGHHKLDELETFTAYIMIDTPDACAPVEFDDMWFNVRFLRPCELGDPKPDYLPDAPNDWQYVDVAKYAKIYDWRDYLCDPQDRIGGNDVAVAGYQVDFKYYQIALNTDQALFLTDAGLGTSERDPNTEISNYMNAWNINDSQYKAYKGKLWKTKEVQGLLVEKVDGKGADKLTKATSTWIRYKNNSGVTGGFHIYVPIQMTYVFGNYPQTTQTKYVALSITKSIAQDHE